MTAALAPTDTFVRRHIGPRDLDIAAMLKLLGFESLEAMTNATVPAAIRSRKSLGIGPERAESDVLTELRGIADRNTIARSYIGMGYYDTITPPVILRNILENPGWYTQYTPYQAEISQGRLEALLNFQTMVSDLTGLPLANASLLDEGTAAAEAMFMCWSVAGQAEGGRSRFFISDGCHPQTIAVVQARAKALGIDAVVGKDEELLKTQDSGLKTLCGVLLQYPRTEGGIVDYTAHIEAAHAAGALAVVACDLLALTLIKEPAAMGADIAVGSAQRFGVPMGYGGPHAAFMATKSDYARKMPGRLIGVSRDAHGNAAYRLTLQTREQHIRRDKATSNICTAQVLLAIMASMYAVYHGPQGLKAVANRVHALAATLGATLAAAGCPAEVGFDTLHINVHSVGGTSAVLQRAHQANLNLRRLTDTTLTVSVDEATTEADLTALAQTITGKTTKLVPPQGNGQSAIGNRQSPFLSHPVFNTYHSETEMLRYITRLQSRDLSLAQSMIPLGSCTMKLNATVEMIPVTWPEFGKFHPFAPAEQAAGYKIMFTQLEDWLAKCTGFAAVSLQPNAGSQGEYAGLLVIKAYHESRGDAHRDVCLIPTSAHGTNPASAVVAGFKVVPVLCDADGNVDVEDLQKKAAEHKDRLAALMVTYPSTHGVFEEGIKTICQIVHDHGGQVYMDGANMNAQVGLTSPGEIGADVCHLNLHKTFCIPHGGGGPGMGPIGVAQHLAPFLPGHPVIKTGGEQAIGPISAAPWGSASILPISWVYIALMGDTGLTKATQVAILNANYIAKRLDGHYPVLYRGKNGMVAHECIIDCRAFEDTAGIKVEDIAKRLMDYGFHAPTMSWPVPGTLMIEPTESESKEELDRFCDAMIAIREEIRAIENGQADKLDNPLKHAPHTQLAVTADEWPHKYTRQQAAFPAPWTRTYKFWPAVGRVDNPYGDRNLVCTCPPIGAYCS